MTTPNTTYKHLINCHNVPHIRRPYNKMLKCPNTVYGLSEISQEDARCSALENALEARWTRKGNNYYCAECSWILAAVEEE